MGLNALDWLETVIELPDGTSGPYLPSTVDTVM